MNEFTVPFPNNSKIDLHQKLGKFVNKNDSEITKNNVKIKQIDNIYDIYAEKNFLFVNYFVKGLVEVFDNYLQIKYDTNAPDWAVQKGIRDFINEFKNI